MTKTVVTPAYPDERGVQSFQESRVNLISDSCVDKALTLKLEQLGSVTK